MQRRPGKCGRGLRQPGRPRDRHRRLYGKTARNARNAGHHRAVRAFRRDVAPAAGKTSSGENRGSRAAGLFHAARRISARGLSAVQPGTRAGASGRFHAGAGHADQSRALQRNGLFWRARQDSRRRPQAPHERNGDGRGAPRRPRRASPKKATCKSTPRISPKRHCGDASTRCLPAARRSGR